MSRSGEMSQLLGVLDKVRRLQIATTKQKFSDRPDSWQTEFGVLHTILGISIMSEKFIAAERIIDMMLEMLDQPVAQPVSQASKIESDILIYIDVPVVMTYRLVYDKHGLKQIRLMNLEVEAESMGKIYPVRSHVAEIAKKMLKQKFAWQLKKHKAMVSIYPD